MRIKYLLLILLSLLVINSVFAQEAPEVAVINIAPALYDEMYTKNAPLFEGIIPIVQRGQDTPLSLEDAKRIDDVINKIVTSPVTDIGYKERVKELKLLDDNGFFIKPYTAQIINPVNVETRFGDKTVAQKSWTSSDGKREFVKGFDGKYYSKEAEATYWAETEYSEFIGGETRKYSSEEEFLRKNAAFDLEENPQDVQYVPKEESWGTRLKKFVIGAADLFSSTGVAHAAEIEAPTADAKAADTSSLVAQANIALGGLNLDITNIEFDSEGNLVFKTSRNEVDIDSLSLTDAQKSELKALQTNVKTSLTEQQPAPVTSEQPPAAVAEKIIVPVPTTTITPLGKNYIVECDANDENCIVYYNTEEKIAVEGVPSGFDKDELVGNTITTETFFGTTVETTLADDGILVEKKTDDGVLKSSILTLSSGTYRTAVIEDGDIASYEWYNSDGVLEGVSIGTTVYRVDENWNVYYMENGRAVYLGIPDEVKSRFASERFWTGESKWAGIGVIERINNISRTLGFLDELWLDKITWYPKWQSEVDAFFARTCLGVDPLVSRICDQWADNTDAPSTVAFGESGSIAAHIEGERISSYGEGKAGLQQLFVYKITFSVSPVSILLPNYETLTFKVLVDGPSGQGPVNLEEGKPGTDVVTVKKNSAPVTVAGSNMIIRDSVNDYSTVCLDFSPTGEKLTGEFKRWLDDKKRLCNSLIITNIPSIGEDYILSGGGKSDEANQQNQENRAPEESVSDVTNKEGTTTGGGI